jgi:hypothetical protein
MNRYILCDLSYDYPNQPDIVKSWVFRKGTLDASDLDSYGWSMNNYRTVLIKAKNYEEAFLKVYLTGELFCNMDFKKLLMNTIPSNCQYLLLYEMIMYLGLDKEIAKIFESKLEGEDLEKFQREISNDKETLSHFIYESCEEDQQVLNMSLFSRFYIFQKDKAIKNFQKRLKIGQTSSKYKKIFEDSMMSLAFNLCDNFFKTVKKNKQIFLKTYGLKNIIKIHQQTFQSQDVECCQNYEYTEYLEKSDVIFL